jgi:hypothetical protein
MSRGKDPLQRLVRDGFTGELARTSRRRKIASYRSNDINGSRTSRRLADPQRGGQDRRLVQRGRSSDFPSSSPVTFPRSPIPVAARSARPGTQGHRSGPCAGISPASRFSPSGAPRRFVPPLKLPHVPIREPHTPLDRLRERAARRTGTSCHACYAAGSAVPTNCAQQSASCISQPSAAGDNLCPPNESAQATCSSCPA